MFAAAFLMVAVALGATDHTGGSSCPAYPPLAPVEAVLGDTGVQQALQAVDKMLKTQAATLPSGLVATVVLDQQTVWTRGYGQRGVGGGPPTSTDLVRIASITKTFTDLLAFKLRDEGVVSLDDRVVKYIPGFEMLGHASRTRGTITLRNLASHLSGLPREAPYPCSLDEKRCNEAEWEAPNSNPRAGSRPRQA